MLCSSLHTADERIACAYSYEHSTAKLWALCNDIYTARYHGDLAMEEELFAMLIDIYRSPETLLQLSGEQSIC